MLDFLWMQQSLSFNLSICLPSSLTHSLSLSNFYKSSTAYLKGWCIPCLTFCGCNSLSISYSLSISLSLSISITIFLTSTIQARLISKDGVYHCRLSVDDTVSLTDSLPPFLFQSLSVSFPLTLSLSLSLSLSLYYYISNFYNSSTAYLKGWCIPCSTFRGCNSVSHSLTHSISLPSSLTNTLSLTLTSTSQTRLISKDGVYHA